MFKKKYVYLKIFRDKVVATNLTTGESISSPPGTSFSSARSVLGNIGTLLKLCRPMVKELVPSEGWHGLRVLIQQMEDLEGGPSQIEERALMDIAEQAGGKFVVLRFGEKELSADEARNLL